MTVTHSVLLWSVKRANERDGEIDISVRQTFPRSGREFFELAQSHLRTEPRDPRPIDLHPDARVVAFGAQKYRRFVCRQKTRADADDLAVVVVGALGEAAEGDVLSL
jgi:hypothetical protein